MHTAMAMGAVYFVEGGGRRTDIALCTVCPLCMRVCQGRFVRARGAEGHFRVCTQGHGVAECTKRGRAAVVVSAVLCAAHTAFVGTPPISSASLPHRLICQSLTTVASFPLSPLFFPLYRISPPPLFFSPSCPLALSLRASDYPSPCVPLPSSSLLHFFNLFLSSPPFCLPLSLSSPLPLFFSSAASMFLCVNSWDAFVEGFHSDGPFEQVVIHVCWL